MKKTIFFIITLCTIITAFFSCNNGETYAEMKEKEKDAIASFLSNNYFVGPIREISESEFKAKNYTTDTTLHEFVLFEDDGIYMQIVTNPDSCETMKQMAMKMPDSTITKNILCRYFEYDIEDADTTSSNIYSYTIVDKMLVKYSQYSQSFSGSFTEGAMKTKYSSAVVPTGWFKPLEYIRLSKDAGKVAKVRMIIPHSSGTTNASSYVLPFYYEITYQLGR